MTFACGRTDKELKRKGGGGGGVSKDETEKVIRKGKARDKRKGWE